MSEERVDKAWQKTGLTKYSTAAILGTLKHYGAPVDEAGFNAMAKDTYPLEIAQGWHIAWKGTGQFARFPWAAASELWRRVNPERLAPAEVALPLLQLVQALKQLLDGAPDAPVGPSLKAVKDLQPRLPMKDGRILSTFLAELVAHLGEAVNEFGRLSVDLAKDGHTDDAEEVLQLEELLFPMWKGISRALMRVDRGESEQGIQDLTGIMKDPARDGESRVSAMDALISLDAQAPALEGARVLFDEGEKSGDFHLALAAGQRLVSLLEQTSDQQGLEELYVKLQKLQEAHAAAHDHG
jgi:hypothetical protein